MSVQATAQATAQATSPTTAQATAQATSQTTAQATSLQVCPSEDNPFDSPLARGASNYARWNDKTLVAANNDGAPVPLLGFIHDAFRAQVLSPYFSCVGAKSAVQHGTYRIGQYGELASAEATAGLAFDLYRFIREIPSFESNFCTFVATFDAPIIHSEADFEKLLWSQLQMMHQLDAPLHQWDPEVSNDPDDPHFAFSFAERGFFIVGMHPAASRFTRRFAWPTLVFNVHEQFEALRQNGKFERMQTVVRQREVALQGSINQNLDDFGQRSDARQYSGRPVGPNWTCPFSTADNHG